MILYFGIICDHSEFIWCASCDVVGMAMHWANPSFPRRKESQLKHLLEDFRISNHSFGDTVYGSWFPPPTLPQDVTFFHAVFQRCSSNSVGLVLLLRNIETTMSYHRSRLFIFKYQTSQPLSDYALPVVQLSSFLTANNIFISNSHVEICTVWALS